MLSISSRKARHRNKAEGVLVYTQLMLREAETFSKRTLVWRTRGVEGPGQSGLQPRLQCGKCLGWAAVMRAHARRHTLARALLHCPAGCFCLACWAPAFPPALMNT